MSVNTRKTEPLSWNLEIWRSNYYRFTSTFNCIPTKNPFFVFLSWKAIKITNGVIQTISRPSPQQITLDVLIDGVKKALLKHFHKLTHTAWQQIRTQKPDGCKMFLVISNLTGGRLYTTLHTISILWWKKKRSLFCLSSHSCSWVEMRRCRQPAPSASQPPWSTQPAEAALPSSRPTSPVMMPHVTAGHTTPADFLQVFFFYYFSSK